MTVHSHPHQFAGTQITNGRTIGRSATATRPAPRTTAFGTPGGRTERITGPTAESSLFVEPAPYWTAGDVWQAFHGYAVARLAEGRNETRTYQRETAHYWVDQLLARGFATEAIIRHQVGLIPSLTEAREHLRSLGFSDYDIDQSGLSNAIAATGGDRRDMLCVPVAGLPGQSDGIALLPRGEVGANWQTVYNGVISGDASHLAYDHVVLTCDPLEALLLNDAGVTEAYAVPANRAAQVAFYESLAECGVDRVTFVTAADSGQWELLRQAAEAACDARCTPAVDLFELPHAVGRSVAFYASQIGAASFRAELARRYQRPTPARVTPTPKAAFDAVTYWAAVRPEIAAIADPHERRAHERLASDVAELLAGRHFTDASRTIDAALDGSQTAYLPRSTSHHVEYVRSVSARDAMAKRVFDLLRTTNGHVTIVTPLSHDEFLNTIAQHAATTPTAPAGSEFAGRFHGRTATVLRSELQTFGHRIQVISTPKPFAFSESGSHLIHHTDVILVDATGEASTFWWQENGWAAHLTELAEEADCDLVAFWAVERTTKTTAFRAELISKLRQFAAQAIVA